MACISAETGTLVYAILNLAIHILGSICSLGLMIMWGIALFSLGFNVRPSDDGDDEKSAEYILSNGAVLAMTAVQFVFITCTVFFSLISLMFSSFLMNGIRKKKPEHIKAYFVFGVVKMVVMLFIISSLFMYLDEADWVPLLIMLSSYFIYSLILYMIHHTYKQYEQVNVQYDHKRLVEKC